MRRYELCGALLLAAAAIAPQAAGPGGPSAPVAPAQGVAQGGAPAPSADPEAVNPDATGFDAATFERVARHQLGFGTLADDLRQVEAWAAEGDLPAARLLAQTALAPDAFSSLRAELEFEDSRVIGPFLAGVEPVIDWIGLGGRTRGERAHVRYALGQLDLAEELPERAVAEFEAVRAAADDPGLRGAAIYNLGTLALQEGELWRTRIPELGGQPPAAPQAPAAPGGPPAPGAEEEPPDPLEQARAYYLQAKEHYVERLRLGHADADTRANTELVFRRLRELDEIERQREEQEQEQEQEQNDDSQDESEDEQEQEDQQQEQEPNEPEDQQEEDGEPQDPESQEPEPQEEEPEPEEPQESEGESEPSEPQESEAQPQPRDEQYMTKEEVQRLLDRLEKHEELGEQLRDRQRQARRRPSARDW